MFVDYYAVLEIDFFSSIEEIKAAYKKQALKWHPDRNIGLDTTYRMQQINEAFLILKDTEAKGRYDLEYRKYYQYNNEKQNSKTENDSAKNSEKRQSSYTTSEFEDSTYQINDDVLDKWMSNARVQAVSLAKQTIEDIIGMSKASGQAMANAALGGLFRFFIFGIIMFVLFKACR